MNSCFLSADQKRVKRRLASKLVWFNSFTVCQNYMYVTLSFSQNMIWKWKIFTKFKLNMP